MTKIIDLDFIYEENRLDWKDTFRLAENYIYKKCIKLTEDNLEKETRKFALKKVLVLEEDIYSIILEVCKLGLKPLVVSSCNDNYPIENVKSGLLSPECDLYRNSNISMAINELLYPLTGLDMLYSPSITIFKHKKRKLTQPANVGLLALPPVNRPVLISLKKDDRMCEQYSNKAEEEKMRKKIELIFKVAVSFGYRAIIVPDFGCPEANPIELIVDFFNQAIRKYPVKYIFFAVKEYENPFTTKKNSKSYEIFEKNIIRSLDDNSKN